MASFDDIEVHRPELARGYLQLLKAQPGRPIALFAPRRVGKTFFLAHDLAPEAKRAKLVPVYADLWLHRGAPLESINHALEEAIDDVTVPSSVVGRIAKTPVKKLAGVEFGEAPARRKLPEQPELRLDALVIRLAQQTGRVVLLMLDEIQALAEVPNGQAAIATLRAVLQKRRQEVVSVFTGSSQEALATMMIASGGPMYQFAQLLDFPVLGDDYLQRLADHYASVHRKKQLSLADLRRVFEKMGFKPALMKDLVKAMSADGITDVDAGLMRFVRDDRHVSGWRAVLASLNPLERELLTIIARGEPPMGKDSLAALKHLPNVIPTLAKIRVALERLRRSGILAKHGMRYVLEDQLFAAFILTGRNPDDR
ncbi:MAG: hypothetical protein ACKVQT_00090 [Burkholderiales bacterium]